jgi:hypothetical protein
MKQKKQTSTIVAQALAEAVAASVEAGEKERHDLLLAAARVGGWLAEQGRPGRWDTLDAEAVMHQMSFARQHEADAFLLSLVALIGHAAFNEQLPFPDARRVLLQIRDLSSSRIVSDLAGQTAGQLQPRVN